MTLVVMKYLHRNRMCNPICWGAFWLNRVFNSKDFINVSDFGIVEEFTNE